MRPSLMCGVLLAGLSTSAAASGNFYLGLRGGAARSSLDSAALTAELRAHGHNVTATVDDSSAGGSIYGGWRFGPQAALELGYTHAGKFATSITGAPVNAAQLASAAAHALRGSGNGATLGLRWDLPLYGKLDFSPRLGAYTWKTSAAVNAGGGVSESAARGTGAYVEAGLSLRLPAGFNAGLGYQLLRPTGGNTIGLMQGQLEYGWGQ